jgi:hypothetical protein
MNVLKRLFSFQPANNDRFYPLTVKCLRCGEILHGQVNLNSELSPEYDDRGNASAYFVRKVLMGRARCFQQVEVSLTFNAGRNLINKEIAGGVFVEAG